MTLDEIMSTQAGEWTGDNAVIRGKDGYFWIVAKRSDGVITITSDGARLGVTVVEEKQRRTRAKPDVVLSEDM